MLLMGDEVRRTQRGNNNAYCQDNELSWFDWSALERHAGLLRFARTLVRLRMSRPITRDRGGLTLAELLGRQRVEWHGVRLHEPDWGHESHTLALTATLPGGTAAVHLVASAFWEPLEFALPPQPGGWTCWRLLVDTSLDPPADAHSWDNAPEMTLYGRAIGERLRLGGWEAHALSIDPRGYRLEQDAPVVAAGSYRVASRTVVLFARTQDHAHAVTR